VHDPDIRPILFDQFGRNLMEDKSVNLDYDPKEGFTAHKCGEEFTMFKCAAQAFGKLEQKDYTTKRDELFN